MARTEDRILGATLTENRQFTTPGQASPHLHNSDENWLCIAFREICLATWPGCRKQDDALVNLGSQYPISPPSRGFYQQQTKVFKTYRLTFLGQCCGDGLEAKRFFTWKGKALKKKKKRLFENISSINNFPPRIFLATWPSRFLFTFCLLVNWNWSSGRVWGLLVGSNIVPLDQETNLWRKDM